MKVESGHVGRFGEVSHTHRCLCRRVWYAAKLYKLVLSACYRFAVILRFERARVVKVTLRKVYGCQKLAELRFLDSMEHMRLEIHWFRIATKITDGFPWGDIIPTAILHSNDAPKMILVPGIHRVFQDQIMKCFSCTGKDRFGFWKLTKIPGEIQADGWLVDWRNRNL